ncbi:MAG: hypothetical protein ABSH52_03690 [Terriglobia bacterium]
MKPANRFNFRVSWRGVRRITGHEEASALVEFGLGWLFILGPMLVAIVYGGMTFYDYEVLAYAVENGANVLASSRINNGATGTSSSLSPCTAAEAAVKAYAYGLNQSSITVEPPTFLGPNSTAATATSSCPVTSGSTTTGGLSQGDFGILSATYPCSMYFPRLGINLCSMANGTSENSSGVVTMSCPTAYCVTAQITVRIE